jgi:nucleoid-associated protein YgaU
VRRHLLQVFLDSGGLSVKLANGLRALALTAFIFSSTSCTTDGSDEATDAVEEENQAPAQSGDEASDGELPSAEAASVEAEQGVETIDANSNADVQALASEQQIAVDEAVQASTANGAGQEMASAPVPGAETEAVASGSTNTSSAAEAAPESSPMPPVDSASAPSAESAMPSPSPSVAAEESPSMPAIADVVAESDASQAAEPKAVKAKVRKKAKHSRKMPSLSGNEKVYIVQPGDTLAAISTILYGSSNEWQSLADMNGLTGKSLIFPGDALKYASSPKTAAFESKYEGLAKQSVTVEKGDTLSKIASRVMGRASYWKMIWRWNESAVSDPNRIAVGTSLSYIDAKELEGVGAASAH